jgi:hypothetical protein
MTQLISNRLPVLEADIKAAHEACAGAARASIEHAIKCGELLTEAKCLLKHGQWLPWLHNNCGLSERSAQRYMRLASKSAIVADLGIAAADRLLASNGPFPLDDLSRGAFGVARNNPVTILVKPCGADGIYVGWCHIFVCHWGDDYDEGTARRTLEGVHESELVAWLRHQGGVDVDATDWYLGSWEPEPDTYRMEKLVAETAPRARSRRGGDQ